MDEQTAFPRVVVWEQRDIPHGTEIQSEIELPGSDGVVRVRQFMRKVDWGDSYLVLTHLSRNSEPAQTFIFTGIKGEVEGDYRTDQIETVSLLADGTVLRTKPHTVKVRLDNPYPGLAPNEMLQQFFKDRPWGSCPVSTDN